MKKRLIATVVAGAVLSTGLLGLTACGLSIPKGERVADAETWKKAFERTDDLTNYTFETSYSESQTVSGTVNKNPDSETPSNVAHNYTSKNSVTRLVLFDSDNNTAYTERSLKSEEKGDFKGKEKNFKSSEIDKAYYELSKEGERYNYYWRASYAKSESKDLEEVSSKECFWTAKETSSFADSALSPFGKASYYEGEGDGTPTYMYNMYDKFTYSNGVYSANLYMNAYIGSVKNVKLKCEVKISFKDGYVIGLSFKTNESDTIYEKNKYNLKYTVKIEGVYALSKVNSTDVSKKANKDINKAIDKAKDEAKNK